MQLFYGFLFHVTISRKKVQVYITYLEFFYRRMSCLDQLILQEEVRVSRLYTVRLQHRILPDFLNIHPVRHLVECFLRPEFRRFVIRPSGLIMSPGAEAVLDMAGKADLYPHRYLIPITILHLWLHHILPCQENLVIAWA